MPGRNLTPAAQTAESPAQSHPAHRTAPSPVGELGWGQQTIRVSDRT